MTLLRPLLLHRLLLILVSGWIALRFFLTRNLYTITFATTTSEEKAQETSVLLANGKTVALLAQNETTLRVI